MGILEVARIRIDWEKTGERIRAFGFTDEDIKRFREKPIEMSIRFLCDGREVPIILRGPHTSIDMKSKTVPYKPLFPITLRHVTRRR